MVILFLSLCSCVLEPTICLRHVSSLFLMIGINNQLIYKGKIKIWYCKMVILQYRKDNKGVVPEMTQRLMDFKPRQGMILCVL